MNSPVIHILLSTYNGEKYIIDQLDSIFRQTYQNFKLFIRDDGSSDSTLSLIYSYMERYPDYSKKIIIIPNSDKTNVGYMESFWILLEQCNKADFYAFCDQDDIWFPDKLQAGILSLSTMSCSSPLLYFSSFYYCDENLSSIRPASIKYRHITLQDVLFYTPAFGFTIMINESLRKLALRTSNRKNIPHDGWLQKIAASCGKIIYDPSCTVYYRRHSDAVTSNNKNILTLFLNWIKNDIFGQSMRKTHEILRRFYYEYNDILSKTDREMIGLYATSNNSISIWWKRLTYKAKFRPTLSGRIALRICFFFNTY